MPSASNPRDPSGWWTGVRVVEEGATLCGSLRKHMFSPPPLPEGLPEAAITEQLVSMTTLFLRRIYTFSMFPIKAVLALGRSEDATGSAVPETPHDAPEAQNTHRHPCSPSLTGAHLDHRGQVQHATGLDSPHPRLAQPSDKPGGLLSSRRLP